MSYKEALLAMSHSKQNELPYADLCAMRGAAYHEHVQRMPVPTPLKEWAAIMQMRFGRRVKIWHMIHTSWLVALLVVRYGEAIEHWPPEFSAGDVTRAHEWERGKTPAGVDYLSEQGSGLMLACAALAALALAAAWLSGDSSWPLALFLLVGTAMTDYLENQMIAHLYRTGLMTLNAWAASTAYAVGDIVRPTTWNDRLFQCVVAGTSAGTQPTWNTTIGNEQADNTVTWQTIAVGLPKRPLFHALFTAAPGETGGGTEVSGGAYARVALHPLDANWNAASGGNGLTDNVGAITFPTPTANWGVISHFAQLTRASGGDMLVYGTLAQAKTVNNGDPAPSFAAGALDLTFA